MNVVDAVGGSGSGRFLRTLRRGGALFPIFPLGFDGHDEAAALGITVSTTQVRSSGAQLGELGALLDAVTVRVGIDSTFDLSKARQVHERAEQGHIQGKIVMTVDQDGGSPGWRLHRRPVLASGAHPLAG